MAQPEVAISGLRELVAQLRRTEPDLLAVLKDVNIEVAERAAGYVRREVPVRSGTLAGSVRVGRTLRSSVVKIGSGRIPYAGPINYGWSRHNIRPNPFIERAKDSALPEVLDLAARRLGELADRVNEA